MTNLVGVLHVPPHPPNYNHILFSFIVVISICTCGRTCKHLQFLYTLYSILYEIEAIYSNFRGFECFNLIYKSLWNFFFLFLAGVIYLVIFIALCDLCNEPEKKIGIKRLTFSIMKILIRLPVSLR